MVSIASPTKTHYEIARNFLRQGTHVLVEKPITSSIDEANELISIARDNQLVLQVGHLERFNAALIGVQNQLNDLEFIESHRLAPFNPRGTDVNVILDLMIHDIDIILNIVGSEVDRIDAKGTRVLSDTTDLANARIAFKNGCVANVTASRVSLKSERKMRFFQQDRCFTVDFQDRVLKVYHKGDKEIFPGVPEIVTDRTHFADSDAILAETRAFIESVRSGGAPLVSGEDGKRALQTAIRITELLST
jgi:predicted dehydrogenase